MRIRYIFTASLLGLVFAASSIAEPSGENWTYFGGDFANTHYSSLDQINADNFQDVKVAWRWNSIETEVTEADARYMSSQFKPTPLVIDGVMYLPTSFCQIVALNAGTGELIWKFDPES